MASVSIRRRQTKSGSRFQVRYRLGGRAYPLQHGGSFATMKEARLRRDLIGPIRELTEILEREAQRLNSPALSLVRNDEEEVEDDA